MECLKLEFRNVWSEERPQNPEFALPAACLVSLPKFLSMRSSPSLMAELWCPSEGSSDEKFPEEKTPTSQEDQIWPSRLRGPTQSIVSLTQSSLMMGVQAWSPD